MGDRKKGPARQIRNVPIGELKPYERNARTHSDAQIEQIAASLREFGWTNPVLIDEAGGIIAGHARVEAARKIGIDEIPCIELAGLTPEQKRACVLADNKLPLNAGWDEEMLSLELEELKALNFNLDLIGFSGDELSDLLYGREVEQPEYDESAGDDVKMIECPKCGFAFPK